MENKKNSIGKDAFALFVITLIAGLCLGFVYQITKEPIMKAEEKAKQEAYQKVFEGASFKETAQLKAKQEEALVYFEQKGISGTQVLEIMEAATSDGQKGYVMTVVSGEGYGGDIKISLGFQEDGTINGMEVLSMSETAGLGEKCTGEEFKSQFAGMNSGEIVYSKAGKTKENEIDALSGATITTKAIVDTVNAAASFLCDLVLSTES